MDLTNVLDYGIAGVILLVFYLIIRYEINHIRKSLDKQNQVLSDLRIVVERNNDVIETLKGVIESQTSTINDLKLVIERNNAVLQFIITKMGVKDE